jgi:hypothetical protein
MKIVKENINFERGLDPKQAMETGIYKEIQNMGVKLWFGWGEGEGEQQRQKFLKNINQFYNVITKVKELGVNPENMEISDGNTLQITGYDILDGNHVVFHVLTKEDGENVIKMLEKTVFPSAYGHQFSIQQSSSLGSINFNVLWDDSKQYEFLNNLAKNRNKIKNFNEAG